jgi:SNF2 family DNA or RNA helicase
LLEQAGFGLITPPWWNQRNARLGLRLHLKPSQPINPSGKLELSTLIAYEWELSLGQTRLTRQEFEALAALKIPLVQVRGQWVQLDVEQIEAALHFWEKQRQKGEMALLEAARIALDGQNEQSGLPLDDVSAEGWVADWLERLSQPERMQELPPPPGLRGQLRPYQRYGFSWLAFLRRWNMGACLADDMGLGKTIQALALLVHEQQSLGQLPGPTLLVCPTSVVTNWQREAARFAPTLRLMIHQGTNRLHNHEFAAAAQQADLVLTSYPLLRLDADTLQSVSWYGVILDEAQNIKNPSAKQTMAARKLNASFRLALTGTPVENRLTELWSLMNFLNPGYLGNQANFRRDFSLPIERFGDPQATERLRKIVSPFILRRVKTDPRVIQDLPEKIEVKEFCTLSEEQATLYQAVVKSTMEKIAESEGMERRGMVLSLLLQLKQICNHPAQYLHESKIVTLNGRSGKLNRLIEMLEELLAAGERALIFTQFAEMGHLLARHLPNALGSNVLYLHGGTPSHMRDEMVRRFQEEEKGPSLFILSLKAGGLGLNLTRASHVFHFDRWWNPAVEDQATDRAFRIGQNRNVEVHKFIVVGTLEEKIDELIESKKSLAQSIIGSGEQWLTELSTEELRDLVQLRQHPMKGSENG